MKNKLLITTFITFMASSLIACNQGNSGSENVSNQQISNQEGSNQQASSEAASSQQTASSAKSYDPSIPQSWLNLFTFDNVTVIIKDNLLRRQGVEYRCVTGKWYEKDAETNAYVPSVDGGNFDIYIENYRVFTYDQEYDLYSCRDVDLDGSSYLRDVNISLLEGKIAFITDYAKQNSFSIETHIEFKDYGTTTLE